MKERFLTSVLLALVLASGCTSFGGPPEPAPAQRISSAVGKYTFVAWHSPNTLFVNYETIRTSEFFVPSPDRLWQLELSGEHFTQLDVPLIPETQPAICELVSYRAFQPLTDGKLAMLADCLLKNPRAEGRYSDAMPWLITWDIGSPAAGLLRPYELPYYEGHISMAPGLQSGIAGHHDPLSDELYWLDPDESRLVDHGLARANRAAWSPDGKWIALFGNKKRTVFSLDWADRRFDLMLLPADCRTQGNCAERIEVIEKDFTGATDTTDNSTVAWSPDSKWLAFGGGLERPGIWIKNIETGELIKAVEAMGGNLKGNFYNPSWSPDGRKLVFIGPPEGGWPPPTEPLDKRSSLYIADVSSLVGAE